MKGENRITQENYTMELSSHDIIVEDARLRYVVGGPSADVDRTIVFLHGWRSDASVWAPVMQALDDGKTRLLAPDLPGFGQSEAPTRPEGVSGYREIVSILLDRLALHGVVLIGHSFGGSIAAALAATRPELVSRLILVDSAGLREDTSDKRIKRRIAKAVKPLFRPTFMQPIRKKIYMAMGAEDYVVTPELTEHFRRIVAEDISSYFDQIQQPTLLIWGEDDEDTPLADGEAMLSALTSAELVVLPKAGHFSFLDETEMFIEHVKDFLT